jgi:hypothetical protein
LRRILLSGIVTVSILVAALPTWSSTKDHQKNARSVADARVFSFRTGGNTKDKEWLPLDEVSLIQNVLSSDFPTTPQLAAQQGWNTDSTKASDDKTNFLSWACWNLLQVQQPMPGKTVGPTLDDACKQPIKRRAYVVHIVHWAKPPNSSLTLRSDDWFVFKANGKTLTQVDFNSDGEPLLDTDTDAMLFAIHVFDNVSKDEKALLTLAYNAIATQTVPQNLKNLAQIIQAVTGASALVPNAAASTQQALVLVALVPGAAHSPYKLSLTATISMKEKPKPADPKAPPTPTVSQSSAPSIQNAVLRTAPREMRSLAADAQQETPKKPTDSPGNAVTPSPVDCTALDSGKPCTINHVFQSNDREWWDVSLGLSVPGIRQTKYTAPSGKVIGTTATHTDIYAFFNLGYDLQNKGLRWPHLDVGIPVTGQPFYRPFVGVGEWLTPLFGLDKAKFPLKIGAFAGFVIAKDYSPRTLTIGSVATPGDLAADLQAHRTARFLFGLDFSVTELVGRVKPKSK